MKKYILSTSILGLFAISAFAQETTYTDLYYNKTLDGGINNDYAINKSNSWNVGSATGTVNTTALSTSHNLIIEHNSVTGEDPIVNYTRKLSVLANTSVNSIDLNLKTSKQIGIFYLYDNVSLSTAKNLNITLVNTLTSGSTLPGIDLRRNSTISVGENLVLKNNANANEGSALTLRFFQDQNQTTDSEPTANIYVGGDFLWKSSSDDYTATNGKIKLAMFLASMTVGGVVDMTNASSSLTYREWDLLTDFRYKDSDAADGKTYVSEFTTQYSVGGLRGSGTLSITNAHSCGATMTFTNSTAERFAGKLSLSNTAFYNVVMDATDPNKGVQYLNLSGNQIASAEINSGKLVLGQNTGVGSLTLNNRLGTLAVNDGLEAVDNIGSLNVENMSISAGKIAISYDAEGLSDTIYVAEALNVSDASKLTINFESASDIKAWLVSSENPDSIEISFIEFGSTNLTEESIADINVVIGEGLQAVLNAIKNGDTITGLGATISLIAVPEPATVAGIFGLFALAFVAYRRRK